MNEVVVLHRAWPSRTCRAAALLWFVLLPAGRVEAQSGLPAFRPINPAVASRSPLGFAAWSDGSPHWTWSLGLDYASAIESDRAGSREYLLDAELLRVDFSAGHDIGRRYHLEASAALEGAYAGWMDGFFNWYHDLFGFSIPARDRRPRDAFAWTGQFPDGSSIDRQPVDLALGDARLSATRRHSDRLQSTLTATVPSHTGPDGYGRGTVGLALVNVARVPLGSGALWESSVGAGWSPGHGDLQAYQREWFGQVTTGLRFTLVGRLSAFGTFYYHTPVYEGTGFAELDRRQISLDFGWILRTKGGRQWRVGMTEDVSPTGPGIDAIFRLGTTW